jgi:hypothetical protein
MYLYVCRIHIVKSNEIAPAAANAANIDGARLDHSPHCGLTDIKASAWRP